MVSFNEAGAMLDDIADGLPKDFYRELNGGIILLPEVKVHPASGETEGLFIMGEYHNETFGLGRYIVIYYGSFVKVFGALPSQHFREELRRVLLHEFIHHLESLGGVKDLELDDALRLREYRHKMKFRNAE